MEELFLGCFLPFQKVNIIHEKQVSFAIATPEIWHRSVVDRANKVVSELLGSHEGDPCRRVALIDRVTYRLHEMGFTEPCVTIDEEGVVDLTGRFSDGMSRRSRQLIRLADDKLRQCV